MHDPEALIRWYLALTLLAAACLPLLHWLARGIGNAVFGVVRPLSLVLVTAIVWWPAALLGLPFTTLTLSIAIVLLGGAAWARWWRPTVADLCASWRVVLAFELAWLLLFGLYAVFRMYQPDILNTEKPMEIALLSSVSRSSEVPAPDPWFAGSSINYYYFGYQSLSTLVRLSGVETGVAFNLALATTFASCATAVAAAALALGRVARSSRRAIVLAVVLAPILLLWAGNLETTRQLVNDPRQTVHAGWWDGVGWNASRIIIDNGIFEAGDARDTINEFPAFSFVLADLHPHVISLPLLASVLALAVSIAVDRRRRVAVLAVAGAFAGLLYASNSWDAPLGVLLVGGAALLGSRGWRERGTTVGVVSVGAFIAAVPFIVHYRAPLGSAAIDAPGWLLDLPLLGRMVRTFGIVTWQPSSVRELLLVHGHWIVICLVWCLPHLWRDAALRAAIRQRRELALAALLLLLAVALVWMPAIIVLGLPLAAAAWIASRTADPARRLIALLFVVGFALALIPEVVFIRDVFSDRMNTVFKLYMQSWLICSLASALAVVDAVRGWDARWRPLVAVGLTAVVLSTLTYAPLSAWDWTQGLHTRHGLNGAGYLQRVAPDDAAVIAWIDQHADAGDQIVEAPGCSYINGWGSPTSRVSAFTGVPTVIGWVGHESQWRLSEPNLDERLRERVAEAQRILAGEVAPLATNVDYVIIGELERFGTPSCANSGVVPDDAIERLTAQGWTIAFTHGSATVLAAGQ